ncbi:MAG: family 16 glycoside hydrolase [Thermogutta sp.]
MKEQHASQNVTCSSASRRAFLKATAQFAALGIVGCCSAKAAADDWASLFDGRSLQGWRASENKDSWRVEGGCLVAAGPRSHLFYEGPVGDHNFRNFELTLEVLTKPGANSGVFIHTRYQETRSPSAGYEVQINNSYPMVGENPEFRRTGGLFAIQDIFKAFLPDDEWFRMRILVVGKRIRVWVNEFPTVDYLEPEIPPRAKNRLGRRLSSGTIALQAHDPGSRIHFRNLRIRLLPDGADPFADPRPDVTPYGVTEGLIDRLAMAAIPVTDFHIHLRGEMTVEKAIQRQAVTGINSGVLENHGRGWPLDTNEKLAAFLEGVSRKPVFVGIQVNDRDWAESIDPKLLDKLDYVLADTMIMPMPDDNGPPVKLWLTDQYTIDDPEAWMERYLRHNLRVLSEPITILANPTWLPKPVAHLYDKLWTEERMRLVIETAVKRGVALEVNATSGFPPERFIRLAKEMDAKFTLGTNNFNDQPISLARCFEMIDRVPLQGRDFLLLRPKDKATG